MLVTSELQFIFEFHIPSHFTLFTLSRSTKPLQLPINTNNGTQRPLSSCCFCRSQRLSLHILTTTLLPSKQRLYYPNPLTDTFHRTTSRSHPLCNRSNIIRKEPEAYQELFLRLLKAFKVQEQQERGREICAEEV